jgi:hypothetical protein
VQWVRVQATPSVVEARQEARGARLQQKQPWDALEAVRAVGLTSS